MHIWIYTPSSTEFSNIFVFRFYFIYILCNRIREKIKILNQLTLDFKILFNEKIKRTIFLAYVKRKNIRNFYVILHAIRNAVV